MLQVSLARLKQGHRTIAYPAQAPALPDRFRGLPVIDSTKCPDDCRACADACPTDAITVTVAGVRLDLGRCLFCTDCVEACPEGAIRYSQDHRLATRLRDDLILEGQTLKLAEALEAKSRRLFGRSLKLRQVSAGGCSACEADLNVLSTVVFDLGRFGIQFVASPPPPPRILPPPPVSANMPPPLPPPT